MDRKDIEGAHYGERPDHMDFAMAQDMDPYQYVITKWVTRHKKKGGVADLLKAKRMLERYIAELDDLECEPGPGYVNQDR